MIARKIGGYIGLTLSALVLMRTHQRLSINKSH